MKTKVPYDERMAQIDGQVATLTLALTQAAMGLLIGIKRYAFGQDVSQYREISWLLLGSLALTYGPRLFLRGVPRKLTFRSALAVWIVSVAAISIPSALIHGLPTSGNWTSTILPASLGPAIVIAAYWLISYLGQRRLERHIGE